MQTEIATEEVNVRDRLLRGLPSRDDYYAHRGWVRFNNIICFQTQHITSLHVLGTQIEIHSTTGSFRIMKYDLHPDGLAFLVAIGFNLEELSIDEQ